MSDSSNHGQQAAEETDPGSLLIVHTVDPCRRGSSIGTAHTRRTITRHPSWAGLSPLTSISLWRDDDLPDVADEMATRGATMYIGGGALVLILIIVVVLLLLRR